MEIIGWSPLYMPIFDIRFNYISLAIGVKKYLEALGNARNSGQPREFCSGASHWSTFFEPGMSPFNERSEVKVVQVETLAM